MTEEIRTEYKRKKKGNGGAIAVVLTLMTLIVLSTALLFLPEEEKGKKGNLTPTPTPKVLSEEGEEITKLAVVLSVDTEVKMVTAYNVMTEEEEKFVYTGAATFFDEYGIQHTAAQLEAGEIYWFTIDTQKEYVTEAVAAVERGEKPNSDGVWEKTGIDYMTIAEDRISFRNQNYRYSKNVCVMNNGSQISITDLKPGVDVVTVRGIGQIIYEIIVTKGHGYISLKNHEDFVGGTITIGSTRVDTISNEAMYLVREGTYLVNVKKNSYSGTKQIVVGRDETAEFDVYEYGSGAIQKGWLTIQVEPLGADLYINGIRTAYTDGLELAYGVYKMEFTEGGYVSYKASVEINQPQQSLNVYLTQQTTDNTTDPSDTTKDPITNNATNGSTGTNTDTENTGNTGNSNTPTEENNTAVQTSVSIAHLTQYELDSDHAVYILGPSGAEIYLDGEYIGTAPIDFEKIIGSCVITVIRSDGGVKNFNYSETKNGEDSYYNFSWSD